MLSWINAKHTQALLFRKQSLAWEKVKVYTMYNRRRLWTSASIPSVQSSWRAESHILAEHTQALKRKMSFIFKLLKFPFPFDCSLKRLRISLAQRADRVHSIKQIFKPFCFWASSLWPKNHQLVPSYKWSEWNKEISSFMDHILHKKWIFRTSL